jgi:hypothetical protein
LPYICKLSDLDRLLAEFRIGEVPPLRTGCIIINPPQYTIENGIARINIRTLDTEAGTISSEILMRPIDEGGIILQRVMVELFVGIPSPLGYTIEQPPSLPSGPIIMGTGNPYLPGEPVSGFSWTALPVNQTQWMMATSEVIAKYGEVSKVRRVFFSVPSWGATQSNAEIKFTIGATYYYDGERYGNSGAVEYRISNGLVYSRIMHSGSFA